MSNFEANFPEVYDSYLPQTIKSLIYVPLQKQTSIIGFAVGIMSTYYFLSKKKGKMGRKGPIL